MRLPPPNADLLHNGIGKDRQEGKDRQKGEEGEKARIGKVRLKTNLPVWLMLVANLGVEVNVASHFSIELAGYYSGLDWFRSDIKFKTIAVNPSVRYWRHGAHRGFFIDVHGGCVWYNMAFGGDSRYQDHDGDTPACGGGVGAGYRLPLGSGPWSLEFAAGVGAYRLDYDVFENRRDGILKERVRKWYVGPDRLAVSIVYVFGGGKGGRA